MAVKIFRRSNPSNTLLFQVFGSSSKLSVDMISNELVISQGHKLDFISVCDSMITESHGIYIDEDASIVNRGLFVLTKNGVEALEKLIEETIFKHRGGYPTSVLSRFTRILTIIDKENPVQKERKQMYSNDIYSLIEAADRCRNEIVLCLLGLPGIGKTEAVEKFAKDHGRRVVHIIASQILPNEVSGMTMPNQETHTMDVFDHTRLGHMKDGDILFLDELLKGQQQVLNACLTLIQERRMMSGKKLPNVLIIAAANPLASPVQLPLEIRQRFMFVDVDWNREHWMDYMADKGFARSDNMDVLSVKIENALNNESARWNELTPRTATKILEWRRSVDSTPLAESVNEYIKRTFGSDVMVLIDRIITDKEKKKSPNKQLVESISHALTTSAPMYLSGDDDSDAEEKNQIHQKVKEINEEIEAMEDPSDTDVMEILQILKDLGLYNAVMKELQDDVLEMDTF